MQMQCEPQSERGLPHFSSSSEGQSTSRHTSREGESNAGPMSGLHTSPGGQRMLGSFLSQGFAQAQFWPHGLFGSPHSPASMPS